MNRAASLSIVCIAPAVLVAGVMQFPVTSTMGSVWSTAMIAALVIAGAAPVLTAIALEVVAPGFDVILLSAVAMLTSIGTAALVGFSSVQGAEGDFYQSIAVRHGFFVGGGFVAMVVGARLARHIDLVRRYPFTLVAVAIGLTLCTAMFGEAVNGARLWLNLGPLRFQPSEIARLILVGFVATYLYERRHLVTTPWRPGMVDLPPAPYLLPVGGAVLLSIGVLIFQNDLGMAALIALGAFAIISAVVNSTSFTLFASFSIACAAVGAYAVASRVRDRVDGWLDPWTTPMGHGFQFLQAEFGMTAGGLLGASSPRSALRVPEVQTDFILTGIGIQFGMITSVATLTLSAVVVLRCVTGALRYPDTFGALLAFSIAAMMGIQLVLIAGGTLRVLPLTGLTFPLLSYGGTSLVATLFSLGIIAGIRTNTKASG